MERAVAWLHEYTWGDEFVFHLACDSRKDRIDHFLTMIDALHATIHDNDDNALLESLADEGGEEVDLAGWPAIVPNL